MWGNMHEDQFDRRQSVEFVNVTVKKFRTEIYVNYEEDSYFQVSTVLKVYITLVRTL